MKFQDSQGKEKKLFICPVCQTMGATTYIDICSEPWAECNVSLRDLRLAAENSNLSSFVWEYTNKPNHPQSNRIFSILFDLFGVVINFSNEVFL